MTDINIAHLPPAGEWATAVRQGVRLLAVAAQADIDDDDDDESLAVNRWVFAELTNAAPAVLVATIVAAAKLIDCAQPGLLFQLDARNEGLS